MTWRIPLAIVTLILLGWLSIWDALRHTVEPDALDLEARRTMPVYGVGE